MDPEIAQSDAEAELQSSPDTSPGPKPSGGRKAPKKLGQRVQSQQVVRQPTPQQAPPPRQDNQMQELQRTLEEQDAIAAAGPIRRGGRIVPVRQSRIQDRPAKVGEKDSSLKIKIELDLEVEVEIYARIKGDVTIGLL